MAFSAGGAPINLAVTAANTPSAIQATLNNKALLINLGPNKCFFRSGNGAQVAIVNDLVVPVNVPLVVDIGNNNNCAAICAATETAALQITPGIEK